jgi:MFS transporter, DHA1 family, tetracycline resistance protein
MTTAVLPEDKLDFKRIFPIFVIVLVDLLGLTIIIPLLPLYAATYGADAFTIGLLGASYPLMQFIGAPILGSLSDRYGRKRVLVISQLGTFIGFMLLGLAGSLWMLFLARILDGLSGANITAAQAAITDSTTEKTRAQGLGLLGAAFGLGFIIGPIIAFASLALSNNNYHIPAFVAAGFSLVSIILTVVWFKETLPAEKRGQSSDHKGTPGLGRILMALRQPFVGTLLLLMFLQQLIFGGFENLIPLFNLSRLGMNASGNANIFVFVGIIIVLVQGYFIGKWSRRFGERNLIYAGLALLSLGLILTSITPGQTLPGYSKAAMVAELTQGEYRQGEATTISVPIPEDGNDGWLGLVWILVAMIPAAVGGGLLSPSINSLLTQNASGDVGGTLGISTALVSAANAITPIIGSAIFQVLGSTAPFLIGGIILAGLYFVARSSIPAAGAAALQSSPG